MNMRLRQQLSATPMRTLLSPFGIGISKHIIFAPSKNEKDVVLKTTNNISVGAPLFILADSVVLTCQAALDADVDGLVPPPAEMLEMLNGAALRPDEVYLAYYFAVRYFTKPKDWYAAQVDVCGGASQTHSGAIDGAASFLWQRATRKYVSAPQPLFLAALRYVRSSSFFKPAAATSNAATRSPPAALAIAPVLDVLVRNSKGQANVTLTACTAKDVTERYMTEDLRGARQALLSKEAACAYWALLAREDIPVNGTLSFSSQISQG
jgi:hypothetical protein